MFRLKGDTAKDSCGEWSIIKLSEQTSLLFLDYQGPHNSEVYFNWPLNDISSNKSILSMQKGWKADEPVYLRL